QSVAEASATKQLRQDQSMAMPMAMAMAIEITMTMTMALRRHTGSRILMRNAASLPRLTAFVQQ
ncbi:MAG: hypothetical protein ACO23B_12440, partial [Burkholderiaceae bacterium]